MCSLFKYKAIFCLEKIVYISSLNLDYQLCLWINSISVSENILRVSPVLLLNFSCRQTKSVIDIIANWAVNEMSSIMLIIQNVTTRHY